MVGCTPFFKPVLKVAVFPSFSTLSPPVKLK
nr:MAG TPA: hypothetical protein [Microviridae sp.]